MIVVKIFFDVETTGTNYKLHSIIQLAGLVEVNGEVVESFDYKVRPHPKARIEPEALRVNNTTEEEIMSYPSMRKVHKAFTRLLSKYVDKYDPKNKAYLIGFNNRAFDDFFLRYFFELCGDRFIGAWFWADTIDVLCLAGQYLMEERTAMPSFKLKRVALTLGIDTDKKELHDALYDSKLTRQIYRIVTGLELRPNDELF